MVVAAGLVILAAAGGVALSGVALGNFYVAPPPPPPLILLGVGWNFGFIGATAMLAAQHRPEERGTGAGHETDTIVFGMVHQSPRWPRAV